MEQGDDSNEWFPGGPVSKGKEKGPALKGGRGVFVEEKSSKGGFPKETEGSGKIMLHREDSSVKKTLTSKNISGEPED